MRRKLVNMCINYLKQKLAHDKYWIYMLALYRQQPGLPSFREPPRLHVHGWLGEYPRTSVESFYRFTDAKRGFRRAVWLALKELWFVHKLLLAFAVLDFDGKVFSSVWQCCSKLFHRLTLKIRKGLQWNFLALRWKDSITRVGWVGHRT